MASVSNSTSVPVNVNNGNLEKATKGDTSMQEHTTSGTGATADSGGASRPNSGGDVSFFDDPMAKKLPISDDLFE